MVARIVHDRCFLKHCDVSLLTPKQMEQFTGRKKPSLQIAWLERQGRAAN